MQAGKRKTQQDSPPSNFKPSFSFFLIASSTAMTFASGYCFLKSPMESVRKRVPRIERRKKIRT